MELLGCRNDKDAENLMLLRIGQRHTRWKNLLWEVQSQGDIVFEALCATFCQVRALDLQHLVVIDHPPHEGPRVRLAFAEVDCALCCKIPSGEFVFIFRDRNFGLVGDGGDRKASPTGRALVR